MKKLLLSGLYLFTGLCTNYAFAQKSTKDLKPTTVNSPRLLLADNKKIESTGKQGFNGLFESTALGLNTQGPQLNPQAISFVKDYIDVHGKGLIKMKDWALPYFNMMDQVLAENGLPAELKYLAVIESRLKSTAVSWAGAVGPWQFMPGTAINYGLKVTRKYDERTDYVKSTYAAAKYLKTLYDMFGDWLLVIAAYNGGAGNVQKAIRKSNSTDFWILQYYLPAESRNHVKKFIGTHYIFEGQGGMTTLTKAETAENYNASGLYATNRKISSDELQTCKTITIAGKYNAATIAKYVGMELTEFNRYNPSFDKVIGSSSNSYELKLPDDKMELFNINKYQILNECVQQLLNGSTQIPEESEPVTKKEVSKSQK